MSTNGNGIILKRTYDFRGKRALVTGAGRGIGRGVAIALANAGAETYALSKTKKNLDSLVAECPSIKPICIDIADWSTTRAAVEAIGPIDLLVNNAAVLCVKPFMETTHDDFEIIYQTNLKGTLNVSQVVAKGLIARGSPGSIVNVSSQAGVRAMSLLSAYGMCKAALDQATRCLALELGPHKIRVNSVNPTVVNTDMGMETGLWDHPAFIARVPIGRLAEVSDIVDPILFLLSDDAQMIHGAILLTDGGYTAA